MRTFSIIALVLTIASFSVPAVVFAGTANGTTCYSPSDCTSGNCVFSDLEGVAKCQPSGTQSQPNTTQTQSQPNTTGSNVTLINPLKGVDCSSGNGNCLTAFLNGIMDFVIQIGSIIVILMLVFVGYKFVVAQGKDAALVEARKMLLWTIIGGLVLLGAKAISDAIMKTVQALGG